MARWRPSTLCGLAAVVVLGSAGRAPGWPSPSAAPPSCGPSWSSSSTEQLGAGTLLAVAQISGTEAWAVGATVAPHSPTRTLAARWDGTAWAPVSTIDVGSGDTYLKGVSGASAEDVWAVGASTDGSGVNRTLIEHWDGIEWAVVASPNIGSADNLLEAVAASSPNDVWAVGSYDTGAGGAIQTLAEHWDGATWTIVPTPNAAPSGSFLHAISATSPGSAWAVGAGYSPAVEGLQTLVERWDGSAWAIVPSPNLGPAANVLTGVAGISDTDAWAVGYANGTADIVPLALHWDGVGWSTSALPDAPGRLFAVVAEGPGDVWGVGSATGWPPTGLVEHWDGTAWTVSDLPEDLATGSLLLGLAAHGRELQAVGFDGVPPRITPAAGRLCGLAVTDRGFSVRSASVGMGATAAWSFPASNRQDHSATDGSGLGLFDSGARPPGDSFTFTFVGAGAYRVVDTITLARSTVLVPVVAEPPSGTLTTEFTVTWASSPPLAGYVLDVEILRPGSSWVRWMEAQTGTDAVFVPDGGVGTYRFRARMRDAATGSASGWSPGVAIAVVERRATSPHPKVR
jgi:hypothetical protein